MNQTEQIENYRELIEKSGTILTSKGGDYANEDKLSNFKQVAEMVRITPAQVALVLIGVKVVRLGNLMQTGKAPNNESINDSVIDLFNYTALLHMIQTEKKNHEKNNDIPLYNRPINDGVQEYEINRDLG